MSFRLAQTAVTDIDEIWHYIAQDDIGAANSFIERMFEHFIFIGRNKLAGIDREELEPGLRSIPFGRYVIFYFPLKNGVEISQIIHGARDIETIFVGD